MNYSTIKDAAITLGVTERWLQMLCKQGKVPGATRINDQGAWMVPAIWIKSEQEKRINMTNHRKEGCNMKKIAFIYDDVSEEDAKELLSNLEQRGITFYSKGVVPIYAQAEEDVIISDLYELIHDSEMVIGVSSSGNGIAIYTNKIAGFTAAPITSISDIDEAIDVYAANAFDVPVHNTDLFYICTNLVERMKETDEME